MKYLSIPTFKIFQKLKTKKQKANHKNPAAKYYDNPISKHKT